MRSFMFAAAALALGACTPLTSNHPLFAVADQTGPPPLTEGVWVALNARCTREEAAATPMPDDCEPFTLHREGNGGWALSSTKTVNGVVQHEDMHFLLAPAVPTARADAYAPLYVAQMPAHEVDPHDDSDADVRIYAALAPLGEMPAKEAFFIDLECDSVLREGPIDGVTAEHNDRGEISACTAQNQSAVREAARRGAIEQLSTIDANRLIFVHP
jgi:hypothetical protein